VFFLIDVLIEVEDISAVAEDEFGDGRYQPALIRARDKQDSGIRAGG
jgi:hypothetical protein